MFEQKCFIQYLIISYQGGIWNTLQDATKERPWLWAIYVIVVFLPIILIIACCLPGKKVLQLVDHILLLKVFIVFDMLVNCHFC